MQSIKKTINHSTADAIIQFYWRTDGKKPHFMYMDKERMKEIAIHCKEKASTDAMRGKAQLLLEILN